MKTNTLFGSTKPPFIIAEMSAEHNKSLERALSICDAVKKSGAHAIKLQTFTADTMTLNLSSKDFFEDHPDNQWSGVTSYEIFQKASLPLKWHRPIFEYCKKIKLICFSTAYDETAVDFLEKLNVPFYKIASYENVHIPLIKKVAKTGKPIIMSTGMATVAELWEAVDTAKSNGCTSLTLLKCTNAYPAPPQDMNLKTIPHMRDLFKCNVGLSDHSLGIGVAIASVAFGATVIEKHVTLSRKDHGLDSNFSLEPHELKQLVFETHNAWLSIGNVDYSVTPKEWAFRQYRRSIYISKDMKTGDTLTKNNIRIIRPGLGFSPKYYKQLLGKKISKDARKGERLSWDHILFPGLVKNKKKSKKYQN